MMSGRSLDKAQLVLVAYRAQSVSEIAALVRDFEAASRIPVGRTIIVDNGGALGKGHCSDAIEIVAGDNRSWEFSGWSIGLDKVQVDGGHITVLLNDSYARNWTIEAPGRAVIAAMVKDGHRGRIAGWLDNFSRTSRRVNSRIVILPSALASVLRTSIQAAIVDCETRRSANLPLFDATSTARLERWMQAQDGRWDVASARTRLPRIFIEHHLFDTVPRRHLSLRPKTWLGSQIYGVARKLTGERR